MSDSLPIEELLTAYFDGELSIAQQQAVEKLLAEQPQHQATLNRWENDRAAFKSLPQFRTPTGFSTRLQSRIAEVASQGATELAPTLTERQHQHHAAYSLSFVDGGEVNEAAKRDFKSGLIAIVALAALLLVAVMLPGPVAKTPTTAALTGSDDIAIINPAEPSELVASPGSAANDNSSASVSTPNSARPITRQPLMMRPRRGGQLDGAGQPMVLPTDFGSDQTTGYSRVVFVRMPPSAPAPAAALQVAIRAALANDAVAITNATGQTQAVASDSDLVAYSIVIKESQLPRLLRKLIDETEATVDIVTPGDRPQAAGQAVLPRRVTNDELDPQHTYELEQLNEWFGLRDPHAENRLAEMLFVFE